MDSTTDGHGRQHISLLESLDGEWIKLPLAVMQDVGPAVQTLGGVLKVTNKETYVAVVEIARCGTSADRHSPQASSYSGRRRMDYEPRQRTHTPRKTSTDRHNRHQQTDHREGRTIRHLAVVGVLLHQEG